MAAALPSDIDAILPGGANSYLDPRLPRGTYCRGWNIVIRAGVPQTRPGTQWFQNFPIGKWQAAHVFEPLTGFPEVLAVIDGTLYSSQYPFESVLEISGIQMSADVDVVYMTSADQSVIRNPDSSLTLINTKRVVLLQDGVSPAAYYDGYNASHLTDVDQTPLGTVMLWSGNRLWVARRNRVYASDYGNPFSFVEQYYLGGNDSLLMPGAVTGMAEVPNVNSPLLLVFTSDDTIAIQSGVYARDQWPTTPNFQHTVFPGIGCISHRGIAVLAGWLYWFSQHGLQSLDFARTSLVSSTMLVADNEMSFSKDITDSQLHQVALAAFDNYLLVSVPYGGTRNAHTWVMDTASIQTLAGSGSVVWASVWTGFQPQQWLPVNDGAKDRLFAISSYRKTDQAGVEFQKNSLIEFFRAERTDSGQDIECAVEMRVMTGNTPTLKQLEFAYLTFSEISGDVDLAVDWRGLSRGQYKRILTKRVRAARGSFRISEIISNIFAFKGQTRRLRTQTLGATGAEVEGSSKSLEANFAERWDWGFQFLVSWCGRAALRSIEPVFSPQTEAITGVCEQNEGDEIFTNWFGFDGESTEDIDRPTPIYRETATFTGYARGVGATATATAVSTISATSAVKQARQAAEAQVDITLQETAPPVLGLDA